MTPAEILDRAADLIDERGLCKGLYHAGGGSLCSLGAMNVAGGYEPATMNESLFEVEQILTRAVTNIALWNDAPNRTKAEVTSTMRAVAATLRAQANREPVRESVTA